MSKETDAEFEKLFGTRCNRSESTTGVAMYDWEQRKVGWDLALVHLEAERAAMVELCARALAPYGADLAERAQGDKRAQSLTESINQMVAAMQLELRSLIPADALQEEIRKARLEEAKWWRDQVPGILTKEGAKMASERLASLQPPVQKGSGSRG